MTGLPDAFAWSAFACPPLHFRERGRRSTYRSMSAQEFDLQGSLRYPFADGDRERTGHPFGKTRSAGRDCLYGSRSPAGPRQAQPPRLVDKIAFIESFLRSPNHDLRGAIAQILGAIGTDDALAAILEAFEIERPGILEAETGGETLYWWYLQSIQDAASPKAAELLAYVVAGEEFKSAVRAFAMEQLYYCLGSVEEFTIPADCLKAVRAFSDHPNDEIASKAIKLLGRIDDLSGHTGPPVHDPATAAPSLMSEEADEEPVEQRAVDFKTVNMQQFLNIALDVRFLTVRPRDFEDMIARMFKDCGYGVEQTPYSCDFGADLVAAKEGAKTAVQVKRYAAANKVGVHDINQVIGATKYYDCHKSLVITTSGFTKSAVEMANKAGVELWNWERLRTNLLEAYAAA